MFAVALARRGTGPFGWIHCARDLDRVGTEARRALSEGRDASAEVLSDPAEIAPPTPPRRPFSQFFLREPTTRALEDRLGAYLGLPLLLQRMVARLVAPEGHVPLVVTGAEALPARIAQDGLARRHVLMTLRSEGVSLVVTFRGTPSNPFRRAFPRVYRVEEVTGRSWRQARVTVEEGEHPTCGAEYSSTIQEYFDRFRPAPDARPRVYIVPPPRRQRRRSA
jgi:hypothetical protein